jgi:hypothetical protein
MSGESNTFCHDAGHPNRLGNPRRDAIDSDDSSCLGSRDSDALKVERLVRRPRGKRVNSPQSAYQPPSVLPVPEVLLEGAFDGGVIGLLSGDNDDGSAKGFVKSLGVDDIESRERCSREKDYRSLSSSEQLKDHVG